MNLCRRCGSDFSSLEAFDRHRVGDHALDFPAFEDGRRCRDDEERISTGLELDGRGRWRIALTDAEKERLSALGGSRLTASGGGDE